MQRFRIFVRFGFRFGFRFGLTDITSFRFGFRFGSVRFSVRFDFWCLENKSIRTVAKFWPKYIPNFLFLTKWLTTKWLTKRIKQRFIMVHPSARPLGALRRCTQLQTNHWITVLLRINAPSNKRSPRIEAPHNFPTNNLALYTGCWINMLKNAK